MWTVRELNPRPPACKTGALPIELTARKVTATTYHPTCNYTNIPLIQQVPTTNNQHPTHDSRFRKKDPRKAPYRTVNRAGLIL